MDNKVWTHPVVANGNCCEDSRASGLVDILAVPDLDDQNDTLGLDDVDDAPVLYPQPSCAPEAVAQWLAEFDGVGGELVFDGPAYPAADIPGELRDVFANDAFQILEAVAQTQALACGIRRCVLRKRSSAMREKWRSS